MAPVGAAGVTRRLRGCLHCGRTEAMQGVSYTGARLRCTLPCKWVSLKSSLSSQRGSFARHMRPRPTASSTLSSRLPGFSCAWTDSPLPQAWRHRTRSGLGEAPRKRLSQRPTRTSRTCASMLPASRRALRGCSVERERGEDSGNGGKGGRLGRTREGRARCQSHAAQDR